MNHSDITDSSATRRSVTGRSVTGMTAGRSEEAGRSQRGAQRPHKPGALERLKERGFFAQCTDEERLKERLDTERLTFYVGVDPTGPSLHVGHLVPVYALAHLVEFGHRGIVIVGDGTARIGDPSGKTEMRRMITIEEINRNAASMKKQIASFLAVRGLGGGGNGGGGNGGGGKGGSAADPGFEMVHNAEWLADLNYIEFLREIGRHFSVNRMLTFEAYKLRMETGLSFIEFNYQLLQSYDYLKLYQTRGCRLQIGGDDQWGNIVAGTDLIRRIEGTPEEPVEAFGLTFPLVTRADGKKMGKSESGAVFLDGDMVSPYDFFQYWRNVPDADVRKFMYLYTFLEPTEIEHVVAPVAVGDAAGINAAKERLAREITTLVHGREEADKALAAAKALFSKGAGGAAGSVPGGVLPGADLDAGIGVLELFSRAGLCSSNSEARRLIDQGGARINTVKVQDLDAVIDRKWLKEHGAESTGGDSRLVLLLQAGKKRHYRFEVT